MSVAMTELPNPASRWSARLALFAVLLIIAGLSLHRVFGLPTPVMFNILIAAFLCAALAVVLGVGAGVSIWRTGAPGAARIFVGLAIGLAILMTPVVVGGLARSYPDLNDVTTDPGNPPRYRALANERRGIANPTEYPAAQFTAVQSKAYPDLAPMLVNRPLPEAFDLVLEAFRRLHYTIVTEEPPTDEDPVGVAEAVDRTLILGFYDDIAVRVTATEGGGTRIDLRSSSRYGRSDFGRNAQRLREIMREIVARLEATVPAAGAAEPDTANKKTVKPPKNGARDPAAARKKRDDVPPNARRGPERKETPP